MVPYSISATNRLSSESKSILTGWPKGIFVAGKPFTRAGS